MQSVGEAGYLKHAERAVRANALRGEVNATPGLTVFGAAHSTVVAIGAADEAEEHLRRRGRDARQGLERDRQRIQPVFTAP